MTVVVRAERPGDEDAIRALTAEAFAPMPYSDGSEPGIVDALRADGDLTLSLVAVGESDEIIGHVALSPVVIEGGAEGWFGLGPISVRPARQREGIGGRLIEAGLAELRGRRARGVVLVGDPGYYARFGFAPDPRIVYPHPGGEYLQRLVLRGNPPEGVVRYARALGG